MAELGVSDEQFVEACRKAEQNPIHKKIVDQIMAVDNFLAFKKLMVKRNQELNRQAMEMYLKMQAKKGQTPTDGAEQAEAPPAEEEPKTEEAKKKQQDELKEVMRVAHTLERAEEEEMMKRAMEESERMKSEAQRQEEEEEE